MRSVTVSCAGVALASLIVGNPAFPQDEVPGADALGKWDMTVDGPDGNFPSWLEIKLSGYDTLVGEFVGQFGSARPVSEVGYEADSGTYEFSIPPQWEQGDGSLEVEFKLEADRLDGTLVTPDGQRMTWTGSQAPDLVRSEEPEWGQPVELIDAELSQWVLPENNQFTVKDGILSNADAGGNLVTRDDFEDFRLTLEFRYPEGSNSGVYLRGRYEVQIEDNYGRKPESHLIGGIYGFIDPSVNAAKPAGEWQSYDITLVGRQVSVSLNGKPVIIDRPIPGITGGALDSDESEPGPLMLQGDHGPVEFRNIRLSAAM